METSAPAAGGAKAPIDWRRNFFCIWLGQFFSIIGFSFSMPFAPYYIQALGVTDRRELTFWVTVFAALAPLTLAIFSPIWGAVADRFGRRLMLIRAHLGSMVFLAAMGCVPNVHWLIGLRVFHGLLTGTQTAAQTLASLHAPPNRSGLVMGALSAAVFSGDMVGAFLGGMFADLFGYRRAFFVSSIFLAAAGLLSVFGVREHFVPPPKIDRPSLRRRLAVSAATLLPVWPMLCLLAAIGMVVRFDTTWLPLLVQELRGGVAGVATIAGSLAAVGGVAGFLAGPLMGRLADRLGVPRIARISAVGAAAALLVVGMAKNFPALFCGRFFATFCAGGLEPVFWVWLARLTSQKHRGFVFGWAATARCSGWLFAPLLGGVVAGVGGSVRMVFFVSAALYLALIPCIAWVVRRLQ